jgi:hypothetical protein
VAKVDKLFVCVAAQLEYGGYGETFGFTPSSTQNPVIVLNGTKKHFMVKAYEKQSTEAVNAPVLALCAYLY